MLLICAGPSPKRTYKQANPWHKQEGLVMQYFRFELPVSAYKRSSVIYGLPTCSPTPFCAVNNASPRYRELSFPKTSDEGEF